ncbi:hypothetical protein FDECE_8179 [Fusarium decemcellulare]|nr:hypothetical protein FDECE_8179 [Fusarium decemcellulare]
MVMDRVANGKIRLSTLQSLCILSMIEHSDGRVMQAGLDLGIAHYFVSSLPHGSALGNPEEFLLCVESILLLQNIQGCVRDAAKPASHTSLLRNDSQSLGPFNHRPTRHPFLRELGNEQNPEIGILPYLAQAAEAWQMARAYAASHVGPDEPPPWHPQSNYSLIMLRHMELDSQYPVKYRFATNNFGGLTPEALQQRREYWGPWLFQQFVYSAIPTLVNHPFLLSMRLKNFRHMMPQTFIHQSFDQISRHSTWIICFLDLVEKQQFQISDPLVAHCVAIVATIHLQHAFVLDDTLRQKAQNGYEKCIRFLDRMGTIWPCVASMAQNLRKLQDSIIMVPSPPSEGNPAQEPQLSWSIDAQLLWDILISEKAVRLDAESDRSMFDDTITLEAEHREHDVAEFAMVGSAGISGHKTVPKEVNAYAPEDDERYHRITSSTTPAEAALSGFNVTDERFFEEFGGMNQMMDEGNSFLQAEDFGKAINDWFSFDL